jgi:hypothetical protein
MDISQGKEDNMNHVDEFIGGPYRGIVFDNSTFGQEGNLDGVNAGLVSKHSFYSLLSKLRNRPGRYSFPRTSTHDPQVIPSIRNSQVCVSERDFFVKAFSAERGSAIFPKVALRGVRFRILANKVAIIE